MPKLFLPSPYCGDYKLARSVHRLLSVLLKGFKNGYASYKVAVWLAKMNAGPKRLKTTFPIVRMVLKNREDLGLTEDEIRGSIRTLLRVGYIEVVPHPAGDIYQQTDEGVRRLPIQYRFSGQFYQTFAYIAFRMAKTVKQPERMGQSPKGRDIIYKINLNAREAPALGEKAEANAYKEASQPTSARAAYMAKLSNVAEEKRERVKRPTLFSAIKSATQRVLGSSQGVKEPLKGQKLVAEPDSALNASLDRYRAKFAAARQGASA